MSCSFWLLANTIMNYKCSVNNTLPMDFMMFKITGNNNFWVTLTLTDHLISRG